MKKIYTMIALAFSGALLQAQVQNFSTGDVIPDFTITDLDGVEHTLYEYTSQGKYVLVDFFAYWCGPCAAWAPTVNEFYHKYGCNAGSVIVIGVEYEGTDAQTHEFEAWAGIDDEDPYPSASGVDGGGAAVHAAYAVAAFPTYIAVSPDNVLLDNDIWPISGVETLEAAFPDGVLVEMECSVNVSEKETASFQIGVVPNPADDMTSLNVYATACGMMQTTLTDATGRTVAMRRDNVSAGYTTLTMDVSGLSAGLYTLTAVMNGEHLPAIRIAVR
ncbi:MAG: redoxin domain-containing protein [Flavobacteriales bacterium]|nr:redoxin domain-containing protein [Flavobacteriales bacterium]